jgi:hypothetical protein
MKRLHRGAFSIITKCDADLINEFHFHSRHFRVDFRTGVQAIPSADRLSLLYHLLIGNNPLESNAWILAVIPEQMKHA